MLRHIPRRWRPGIGALLLCLAGAVGLLQPPQLLRAWQERVFDTFVMAATFARDPSAPAVLVVDIGATDDEGFLWTRAASARLAARLAELSPAAVAYDIVFSGNCGGDTANVALSAALPRAPSTIGFLLTGTAGEPPLKPPALALTEQAALQLWSAPGAELPCPAFFADRTTVAGVSLRGDAQAMIRKSPAAVIINGAAYPSLPVEAVRLARKHAPPLITMAAAGHLALQLGDFSHGLDQHGEFRFQPSPPATWSQRTIPARSLLERNVDEARFRQALIFVGSSLPQRGGLRPTAASPVHPSVQIHADAAIALMGPTIPHRPLWSARLEAAALAIAGVALLFLLPSLPAVPAFLLALGLGLMWALSAAVNFALNGRLLDPSLPALFLVIAALVALLSQAAATTRAERALHQRLDQLLPAPVISRLIENPRLLRLKGEVRDVTALCTDLESFSRTVDSLPPERLIEVLDSYFEVVSGVILRHGGMIDKFVGDGMHALFNAPLDQPGHVDAALDAASEIVARTEQFRAGLPGGTLGRTRIGVETGPVILGDVGSGAKIDYTALGNAVNFAARLQEAGKRLGPSVIIGPVAASRAATHLISLAEHDIRSFGRAELFTVPAGQPRSAGDDKGDKNA